MGACIGRYAGRLASGYSIDQDQYSHKKENAIQLMEEHMDGSKLFGKYMICTLELFRMLS